MRWIYVAAFPRLYVQKRARPTNIAAKAAPSFKNVQLCVAVVDPIPDAFLGGARLVDGGGLALVCGVAYIMYEACASLLSILTISLPNKPFAEVNSTSLKAVPATLRAK